MLVRELFSVSLAGAQSADLELPIDLELGGEEVAELRTGEDGTMLLSIDRPVDPLELTIETESGVFEPLASDERRQLPTIRVPAGGNIRAIDIASALTFLTDVPLSVNAAGRELLPEGVEDRAALEALGTALVYSDTTVLLNTRTFNPTVNAEAVRALIPKTVGLRLYADAVALSTDVARYRELWRCLESAFGLKNSDLVGALAGYEPAQEMEFSREELDELLVLRGRVSHAESRAGLKEILRVGDQASKRVARLKCLVERVVLTKKEWGASNAATEELTPAVSWITREGQMQIQASSG